MVVFTQNGKTYSARPAAWVIGIGILVAAIAAIVYPRPSAAAQMAAGQVSAEQAFVERLAAQPPVSLDAHEGEGADSFLWRAKWKFKGRPRWQLEKAREYFVETNGSYNPGEVVLVPAPTD